MLVGRPNVGKSTLANRMTRRFEAGSIVHDSPGVTRDPISGLGWWTSYEFHVVDTGGIVFDDAAEQVFMPQIRQQALTALGSADVAVLVVDGTEGCTPLDEDIANFLRRQKVPLVLAVNKCESEKTGELQAADFWQLGMGTPYPVSGIHGTGMGELMDAVTAPLERTIPDKATDGFYNDEEAREAARLAAEREEALDEPLRVAILGKPNVGKSSLLNRLTRTERAIVSDIAGTTRDVIDQKVKVDGTTFLFLDTAGVRRAARVGKGKDSAIETLMVRRALKAVKRSDVCLLVVDATDGVSDQESRLAEYVVESGCACVIAVNKWDAVSAKDDRKYREAKANIAAKLPALATGGSTWAEQVFVSAKTGLKTAAIFSALTRASETHRKRVSTAVLNEVLEDAVRWQRPPAAFNGKQGSVYYCAQVSTRPPTIVVFVNDPDLFSQSYRRYLESSLRKSLGFEGTPLRMLFRARRSREPGAS